MSSEGIQEQQFRADPGSDPIEKSPEFKGASTPEEIDEAMTERFDVAMTRLDENPNDADAIREANILVERYSELAQRLRSKLPQN